MALDDRERNFEKAVARELRADALNGLHCPDAETLAAYHERMLSPEEMVAQKPHIASCARCQEILATLELTETVAISERDSEEAVAPASARRTEMASAVAVSSTKRGSVTPISKRRAYLRWVVPAGAIAAGLLVWVAVRENRAPRISQSKSVEVAENRDSGKADLGVPQPERREALPGPSGADKPTSKLRDNEKQELDALVADDQAKPVTRARVGNGTGSGRGPSLTQNQIQNSIQNNSIPNNSIENKGQNAAQNPASREFDYRVDNKNADKKVNDLPLAGRNVVGAMKAENAPRPSEPSIKAKVAPAVQAPAPPAAPKQSYGEGAGAAAGTLAKSADADAAAHKDEAVKSVTETVEVTSAAPTVTTEQKEMNDRNSAALSLKAMQGVSGSPAGNLSYANMAGMQIVATPDPKVFWLIGSNGTVLKTEDGDKSLRVQKTGEGMKVLAGSAVNKKVCWLIAEKGIVLRTTDGGKHWLTINAPSGANFSAIKAMSATEAMVTDASGRVTYSTVDGGETWSVVARP